MVDSDQEAFTLNKILVLGMGPGSPRYLLPITRELAGRCDVLIGGRRNLALLDLTGKDKVEITADLDPLLDYVRAHYRHKKIGVLVSGDPGFFSMLARLEREFGSDALDVYPGISSVQYLFARLKLSLHDALFLSLHGREKEDLAELVRGHGKVVLLTDTVHTPALICAHLLKKGVAGKKVWLGENLTYDHEKITAGSLDDFAVAKNCGLNVMVILNA